MTWIRVDIEKTDLGWAWVIKSEYDDDLISYLRRVKKNFPGWDYGRRAWIVPAKEDVASELITRFKANFTLNAIQQLPHLFPDKFAETVKNQIKKYIPDLVYAEVSIEGLKRPLYPFQAKGITLMTLLEGRALLADEMGLGKTVQALGFWAQNQLGKTLIVCTKSTKCNWQKEILDWLKVYTRDVEIIKGTKPRELDANKKFYIINYHILKYWQTELCNLGIQLLILDECHYIKNSRAQWTKVALHIAETVPYVLALTGTPILNRVIEMWNILKLLRPDVYSSKANFTKMFTYDSSGELSKLTDGQAEAFVTQMGDDTFRSGKNLDFLGELLEQTVLIRRTKKEVLPDLPEKVRTIVHLEMDETDRKKYFQAEVEFNKLLKDKGLTVGQFLAMTKTLDDSYILAALEMARQAALMGKLSGVIEWIENFLEGEGKLVVFVHHLTAIERLQDHFNQIPHVTIKGGDSENKRQKAIEQFQDDPNIRLAIISITAGGEGITLTAASNAIVVETAWSPGKMNQAEDRIHRIGQEADSVTIWHMVAVDTIDEPIYKLLLDKQELQDQIFERVKTDNGKTFDEMIYWLNYHLNVYGLKVTFDNELLLKNFGLNKQITNFTPLPPNEEWLTFREAQATAKTEYNLNVTVQNLWDDIKAGRLIKGTHVIWIEQSDHPKGGTWRIAKSALLMRVNQRKNSKRGRKKAK